jgi:hypothetical protein
MDGGRGALLRFGSGGGRPTGCSITPSTEANSDPRLAWAGRRAYVLSLVTAPTPFEDSYLVDSASSHMLVSKIKPCMSKYKQLYGETANGSLNQLSFI